MTTKPSASGRSKVNRCIPRPAGDKLGQHREPKANEVQATSIVEWIYAQLESKIVTLALPPGALLSELVIGREFGVSRTPVGEALQRLAREGLVTILPRRGIVVTDISVSEQLRLLEFRREIAKFIARAGANRANAMERDALRRVSKAFLQAAEKGNEAPVLAADKEFHDLFATCAHNNFAATAMGPLDSLFRRFFYVHKLIVGNIHCRQNFTRISPWRLRMATRKARKMPQTRWRTISTSLRAARWINRSHCGPGQRLCDGKPRQTSPFSFNHPNRKLI